VFSAHGISIFKIDPEMNRRQFIESLKGVNEMIREEMIKKNLDFHSERMK
jgi:hypothetical protein